MTINNYTTSTDAFADISEGAYSSSDYPVMANFVTVASRLIDALMGRWAGFFYPTTDTQTLYYDGTNLEEQSIDEFVSIAQVSVSEQGGLSSTDYTDWTLNVEYLTRPYNAAALNKPIDRLELVYFNGTKSAWYGFQRSVRVTGIPGYSLTPPDIVVQAAKIQAVQWFMRAKQGYQTAGNAENKQSLSYTLDENVKQLLWSLVLELT